MNGPTHEAVLVGVQMKAMLRQMPGGFARLQAAASLYCSPTAFEALSRHAEAAPTRAHDGALNSNGMWEQLALYLQLTLYQLGLPLGS